MRHPDIFPLRIRAEGDKRLANASLMILLRIISERANSTEPADWEFELPWSKIKYWTGICAPNCCYYWINHLIKCGYLIRKKGLFGAPPRRRYLLCLKYAENSVIKHPEKRAFKYAEKDANHIYSPSDKVVHKGKAPKTEFNQGHIDALRDFVNKI